jgi:hypothetical protein
VSRPGVPRRDRDRGHRPVGTLRFRYPGRAAERADRGRQEAPGRAVGPRCSPRFGNASPVTCSATAAPWPTRHGSTAGSCLPAPTNSRPSSGNGSRNARPLRPDTEDRAAWVVKERLRMLLTDLTTHQRSAREVSAHHRLEIRVAIRSIRVDQGRAGTRLRPPAIGVVKRTHRPRNLGIPQTQH